MLKNACCLFLCVYLLAVPLRAESLADFQKRLPTNSDPNFIAATVRDLSVYQTWSRYQDPTGWCTVFSFVAAVEAAYTRKYCDDTNSGFYKAGYCQRYEAVKAANLPAFELAKSGMDYFQFDKKDLDLSELYFVDRVLTSWTTSSWSKHETGNPICHLSGIPIVNGEEQGIAGSACLMLSQVRLPEEKYAEFIYDAGFFATAKQSIFSGNCESVNTPSQEALDTYEYSDKKIDFKYYDNRPLHRAFLPFEARRHASFGVSDMVFGKASVLSDKVNFLEKCIFAEFEVAVHGAQPGHSMLLVGYDRNRSKFLYKDHYHRFVEVDYKTTRDYMTDFDIIIQPAASWSTPSREEMWVGPWDVTVDGQSARLVIRRTRLAPNAQYGPKELCNLHIPPLSTTSWARVGTFYETDSSRHIVYGRLNNSGGDTMDLIVDLDHPEPPPPSAQITGSPAGNLFHLRMFHSGAGAGAYVAGDGLWQGKTVGVLLKRPGQNPYGLIPRTPAAYLTRSKWLGRFLVRLDQGELAYLDLDWQDEPQTLKGTFKQVPGGTATVTATFVSDNEIALSGKFTSGTTFSFRLFYHSGDDRLISGTFTSAYTPTKAAFGYRMTQTGETRLHARMFFPYYDLAADCFNGFAVSNIGTSMGILKFSAFTNGGDLAIAPRNPSMWYLLATEQMARLAPEVFGAKPAGASQSYWIELEASSTQIGSFAQFGDGVQMLDGAVPWSGLAKEIYFSRVYTGNGTFRGRTASTILAIANPGDQTCLTRFDLIGPDGHVTGHSQPYLIGPKRVLQRDLSVFFAEEVGNHSGGYIRVRVESGEGVVAAAVVRLSSNTTFSLNALYPESSMVLYSAQIASTPGYFTNIKLINSGDVTRTVAIRGVSNTGGSLGTPKTVELLAGSTYSEDVASLLGLASSAQMLGSLKVEADGPGVVGDVVFGEPGSLGYVAALPLQGTPFTKALFSHVANGLGYFTGLAIYNPNASSANVLIKIYSKDGVPIGQKLESIDAGERLSKLLPEIVSASAGQLGGYVVVESSAGIVAQELFASGNLKFLSSVPPAVLE